MNTNPYERIAELEAEVERLKGDRELLKDFAQRRINSAIKECLVSHPFAASCGSCKMIPVCILMKTRSLLEALKTEGELGYV